MTDWSYEGLWQKVKLYAARAMGEDREGSLFPFWATLALEFLARATLAKVHPALVAEPDCILHAFGYEIDTKPKSVFAKTVYSRCQKIVPGFGQEEFTTCMAMVDLRNEELHSGSLAFEALPTRLWLADYFRICKLLLDFQQRSLVDVFGAEDGTAAEKMIAVADEKVLSEVRRAVGESKGHFEKLNPEEQKARREHGAQHASELAETSKNLVECPACKGIGVITGERIRAMEPRLENEILIQELVFLPTQFVCPSCGLQLNGHARLHAAGLGGQYSRTESHEAMQYYGEQFMKELAEDYEGYMNE